VRVMSRPHFAALASADRPTIFGVLRLSHLPARRHTKVIIRFNIPDYNLSSCPVAAIMTHHQMLSVGSFLSRVCFGPSTERRPPLGDWRIDFRGRFDKRSTPSLDGAIGRALLATSPWHGAVAICAATVLAISGASLQRRPQVAPS
jgi:hypothetical protein